MILTFIWFLFYFLQCRKISHSETFVKFQCENFNEIFTPRKFHEIHHQEAPMLLVVSVLARQQSRWFHSYTEMLILSQSSCDSVQEKSTVTDRLCLTYLSVLMILHVCVCVCVDHGHQQLYRVNTLPVTHPNTASTSTLMSLSSSSSSVPDWVRHSVKFGTDKKPPSSSSSRLSVASAVVGDSLCHVPLSPQSSDASSGSAGPDIDDASCSGGMQGMKNTATLAGHCQWVPQRQI